jgi:hypothetical protein
MGIFWLFGVAHAKQIFDPPLEAETSAALKRNDLDTDMMVQL